MKRTVVVFVVVMLLASTLQAEDNCGDWRKVDHLKRGSQIIVRMMAGEVIEGAFRNADRTGLNVITPKGARRYIAKRDVREVFRAEPKKVKNGLMVAALGGTIAAGLFLTCDLYRISWKVKRKPGRTGSPMRYSGFSRHSGSWPGR